MGIKIQDDYRPHEKEIVGYYREEPTVGKRFSFYTLTSEEGHWKIQTSHVREVRGNKFVTITGSTYLLEELV